MQSCLCASVANLRLCACYKSSKLKFKKHLNDDFAVFVNSSHWATNIQCGPDDESDQENNSTWTGFYITLTITDA